MGGSMTRLLLAAAALMLALPPAAGRTVLRNDNFEAGGAVAFYTRIGLEESFASVFDVPADYPTYKVCRVLIWVGPNAFNIYTVRLGIPSDDGSEAFDGGAGLIWQSDQDAYQIFGSQDQISSIDLSEERIVTDAERLRVQFRVVTNERSPNVAVDGDGITPERNYLRVLLRNGQQFRGFTELMDPDGSPPQPPGDWIIRVEIAHPEEACGDVDAPLPDMGPPDGVFDFGPPDAGAADAGVPEPDADAPDAAEVDQAIDASDVGVPEADAGGGRLDAGEGQPDRGAAADRGAGGDVGLARDRAVGGDPLELTRIVPQGGPADRNTAVLINGRGFLDGGGLVAADLGAARLLEIEVLSGSTLNALVPAGLSPGSHDLRLTRSDGQVAILPDAFTVEGEPPPPLEIRAVEPKELAPDTPGDITIYGAGFTADTTFSVGGALLIDVLVEPDGGEARGTLLAALMAGTYDLVARRGDDVARLENAITVRGNRAPAADGCASAGPPTGADPWWLLLVLPALRRRRR